MPLNEAELRSWMEMLAPSNHARRTIIYDLLRHAGEDHMTAEDRDACTRAIGIIQNRPPSERVGPVKRKFATEDLWPEQ